MEISFTSLAIVAATGFIAPLAIGLVPRLRLPSVVLEIVLGIVIGPSVLGWAKADEAVEIMALIGLSFLLVIAVLKDADQVETSFGQLVIAGSSIAEVGTIVLLTLFFSGESSSVGAKVVLLGLFGLLCAAVVVAVTRVQRSMRVMQTLVRLQDTTAQIRVRGAFVLLAVFVVLASKFGLEAILGAFLAGAILKFIDRDQAMTHPRFRQKLEAAGFGVFIPFFFVTSGIKYDAGALFGHPSTLARVPLFLAILLAVRGLPALLYRPLVGGRETTAGALLQATSVGFFVVATQIGQDMGLISAGNAAGVIAAGLLSVILFPVGALALLRQSEEERREPERPRAAVSPS